MRKDAMMSQSLAHYVAFRSQCVCCTMFSQDGRIAEVKQDVQIVCNLLVGFIKQCEQGFVPALDVSAKLKASLVIDPCRQITHVNGQGLCEVVKVRVVGVHSGLNIGIAPGAGFG